MDDNLPFIGIDFGTSKSAMAWYNPRTQQAEILRNAEGADKTPSLVYYDNNGVLVGEPAENMLPASDAHGRFVFDIKRHLIQKTRFSFADRSVKPSEVAATIIRKLREDAATGHFHRPVERAVITYPATLDSLEQDAIEEAARAAGFTEVALLQEPVAAAFAYAGSAIDPGRYTLVYDLGAGTFDVAVVERNDDGSFQVRGKPLGLSRCGGDAFDEALYDYFDHLAEQQFQRPISLTGEWDRRFLQQLRKHKEGLTTQHEVPVIAELQSSDGPVKLIHRLNRETFEGLIRKYVEHTVATTRQVIAEAESQGHPVETVVLIGGAARVPLVQQLLQETLPLAPQKWHQQDVAVALGAAYYAQRLWGTLPAPESAGVLLGEIPPVAPPVPASVIPAAPAMPPVSPPLIPMVAAPIPDPRANFPTVRVWSWHSGPVLALTTSAAGAHVIAGGADQHITIWNPVTSELTRVAAPRSGPVVSLATGPDPKLILVGTANNTLQVWDIADARMIAGASPPPIKHASAGGPLGRLGLNKPRVPIALLQQRAGQLNPRGPLPRLPVWATAVRQDGGLFATAGDDWVIRLWRWQVPTGKLRIGYPLKLEGMLSDHTAPVWALTFGWNGTRHLLASASADGTVKVWDGVQGLRLSNIGAHPESAVTAAFRPDGRLLVSSGVNDCIRLWNPLTGEPLGSLGDLSTTVLALAFSPAGQVLASGGMDGMIRLWDVQTGTLIRTFTGHTAAVTALTFDPHGRGFTSAGADGTIRLWIAQNPLDR